MNTSALGGCPRLTLPILVAILAAGSLASLGGQDFKTKPSGSAIAGILKEGFPEARDRLAAQLAAASQPGKPTPPRPSELEAFSAWLDLWRWCEVFARDADAETASLVQHHFFREKATSQMFLLTPGQVTPADLVPVDRAEAVKMAASPEVRQALERSVLPRGATLPSGSLASLAGPLLAADLLANPAVSRAFFSTLSSHDYLPLVLQNLRAIREAHPLAFLAYSHLAIALAVVNDSALPAAWPHHQVDPALVPKEIPPVAEQFARWVAANEAKHLDLDPRRLAPDQLKFVVDAFVSGTELDWARKNTHLPRSRFDRAFFQVPYSNDRIAAQQFSWISTPYTLENIRKTGGICVDQAYYAMIAGKANGLPTLFFTGQGKDGGHAWFGYMKSDDRWELDCGRYSQQNYAVGQAFDPQTWQPISDHELAQLAARFRDKPEFTASMNQLAMAEIFQNANATERESAALLSAMQACSQNPDAWDARAAFLVRTGAPAAERRRLHEEAIRRFANIPDLKVRHQSALAAILRETGDAPGARAVERGILLQNRNDRSDLSVGLAARKVQEAVDAGNLDAAAMEFHRQLHTLGKTGGGDFVKEVAVPYIDALLRAGNKVRARRAIDALRQEMSPERGSLLDTALKNLEQAAK
jgi:hypothetical protein